MEILSNLGPMTIVVTEAELQEKGMAPPKGWVHSLVRSCWVHPEWIDAERKNVRSENWVY